MEKTKKRDYTIWLVLLLAALVRGVAYIQQVNMYFRADDFGPLLYPATLAGYDLRTYIREVTVYYGFGFSWIYTPLFMLFSDFKTVLIGISAITYAVVVLSSGYIYWLSRRFLKIRSKVLCVLIAVMATIFEGDVSISYSGCFWYHTDNELGLYVSVWLIVGLLLALYELEENIRLQLYTDEATRNIWKKKRWALSIGLGLALCWGLMVHERSMSMVVAILMAVVIIGFLRKTWIVHPGFFFPAFVMGFVFQRFLRKAIITYFWGSPSALKNTSVLSGVSLDVLTSWTNIKAVLIITIGNLHAFLINGYGLPMLALVLGVLWGVAALIRRFYSKSKFGKDLLGESPIDRDMMILLVFLLTALIIIVGGLGVRWGINLYEGLVKKEPVYAYKGICYSRYYYMTLGPILFALASYIYHHREVVKKYLLLSWAGWIAVEAVFVWKVYPYTEKKYNGTKYAKRGLSMKLFSSWTVKQNLFVCIIAASLILLLITLYVCRLHLDNALREKCLLIGIALVLCCVSANRIALLKGHGYKMGLTLNKKTAEVVDAFSRLRDAECELPECIYLDVENSQSANAIQLQLLTMPFVHKTPTEEMLTDQELILCDIEKEELQQKGYSSVACGDFWIYTNDAEYLELLQQAG